MRKFYSGVLLLAAALLFAGTVSAQTTIAYTPVVQSCGNNNITLSGVNIQDVTGIVDAGANMPRIYFRKNTGAWFSTAGTQTGGDAFNGDWSFVITASMMGGLGTGNTVQYYVVAQNAGGVVSSLPAGAVATDVNTVTVAPAVPNSFIVRAIPTATLSYSPTPACVDVLLTLSASAVTGTGTLVSYNWSGPNSFNTTGTTNTTSFTPLSTLADGQYSLTVTYPGDGCVSNVSTKNVIVNPPIAAITGSGPVCVGATTVFSNISGGGTWSSSNTSVATIGVTGIATGVGAGVTTITYKSGACIATTSLTVNETPSASSGIFSVCVGNVTTLTNPTPGPAGTWSSSNPSIASIADNTIGDVTGVIAGNIRITYTLPTGCFTTSSVSVISLPSVIGGSASVCEGATANLTSSPSGGVWSSSAPAVGTISSSGVFGGVSAGTTGITYTAPVSGCIRTRVETVNITPSMTSIPDPAVICIGYTAAFSGLPAGGTWSKGTSSIANIDVVTGVASASGLLGGTALISYILPSGCKTIKTMTVNRTPLLTAALPPMCEGTTNTQTANIAGGDWISSDPSVASIVINTGFLQALTPGTSVITYTTPEGCFNTKVATVNPIPTIMGGNEVCVAETLPLTGSPIGGTWASNAVTWATVNSSGLVTGVSANFPTITYSVTYPGTVTCRTTKMLTVNPLPAAFTGTTTVCVGNNITLSSSTAGGTWSSSNPAVGSIADNTVGVITGMSAGTATISYTLLSTGCVRTTTVTVNPLPAPITGTLEICQGFTTTLATATVGGVWISSTPSVATINSSTGIASGITGGTSTISYRISATGCIITDVLTIDPTPAVITGPLNLCVGGNTTLISGGGSGAWTSNTPAVATAGPGGVISGIGAGTSVITYTETTGCLRTAIVTVNTTPVPVSGTLVVCEGATTNLISTPGGGTWSSANTALATVNSTTGVVTGVSQGAVEITYNLGGGIAGCLSIATVTVNPRPMPLTGFSSVCIGSVTTLSSLTAGGTWLSGNPLVASVDGSGNVTGVFNGTSTISYTLSNGCARTQAIVVNGLPNSLSGVDKVCIGSNISLGSSPATGTWSSSDVTKATISSSGGVSVVTGAGVGTVTISYILPTTGCFRTKQLTVNPLPTPITGLGTVCVGATITLNSTPAGGTWTSATVSKATVDAVTGVVTGIATGASAISYTNPEGCRVSTNVTVVATPATISGSTIICQGSGSSLSNSTAGGTWASSTPAVASILTGTGYMTGNTPGTATITYSVPSGCFRTTTVTVNTLPDVIAGATHEVCVGSAITLTNTMAGGTWSSSALAVGTVNATSGLVRGIAAGTTIITYKLPTGCYTTDVVTVNSLPTPITGSAGVCMGFSTVLSTITPGGVWSSSNTTVATINVSGTVSSVAPGTATMSYTSAPGCIALKVVTVNPVPVAIGGSLAICTGTTSTLTNASGAGTWSSSNTAVATVTLTSGVVTGQSAGTSSITFTLPTGCYQVATVTINALPATISGVSSLCAGGSSSAFSSATLPGTWTSSNVAVATINSATGIAISAAVGTTVITYTATNSCIATKILTVITTPSPISGLTSLCQGTTTGLSSSPGGGTWTSSVPTVATIGTSNGLVSGVNAGVTIISYALSNGCGRGLAVTVEPSATLTSGPAIVCVGATSTLTYDIAGGSWLSANVGRATVNLTTGEVTGISAGTVNITYILPTGCKTVTNLTVNALPAANTGIAAICLGLSTTLSNTTSGVVWSSANAGVATVGSATGIVVGTGVGFTDITATAPGTGCKRSTTVTVNSLPSAIGGASTSMCIGSDITLTSTPAGGTWSSSSTATATVGLSNGIVHGVLSGTATITYKLGTGCQATRIVTVLPQPNAITGTNTVCVGSTTVFFTPTMGGVWSSSNNAIAQVGTDGIVTGISTGVATIRYEMATTCFVTRSVTVLPTVSPVTGVAQVCEGSTTSLSSLTPGGTWFSSNTFAATVNASGLVTGQAAGTTVITYTAPSGCFDTKVVTVNPIPGTTSGTLNICNGSTSVLINPTAPGTWSTGNPVVATVDASTGIVTANSTGTARITYTITTGCRTISIVTVTALPASITGFTQVCEGGVTPLGNATIGGTWTSSDEAIATISTTGIITGVAPGTVTISYTMSSGCASSTDVTVNAAPNDITGVASVCLGTTSTLSATPAGGAFTSSNSTIAAIGVTSGVLTGNGVGNAVITYTLGTGCRSFAIATVNQLPGAITGVTNICEGGSTTLSNAVSGGVWSSDFISVAYIDPTTGEVTGNGIGIDTIRYTLIGGCSTKTTLTVNAAPTAIAGDLDICLGETSALTNAQSGGTWSSSNTAVATVGLSSGLVMSHSAGTTNITYSVGAGCIVHSTLVVNPSPSAIAGPTEVCSGSSITLLNSVAGGTWTSTAVSVASVDGTTGVVTGNAAGTATIRYLLAGGCIADFVVTVNSLPLPITGVNSICQGAATIYTTSPTGGIWTSSAPSIAPVNLITGEVTGVATGVANISYTLLGTGCYAVKAVTVNPVPDAITGTPYVCVGSATLLSTLTVGGTWTSVNTTVALVGSATGLVQGLSADTTTIIYTVPTGCTASVVIAVNPLPDNIVGADDLCVGSSTTFTDPTAFGTWSSSNTARAIIDATTGVITGVSNGTATITYTLLASGCYVIKQVTVNPLPPAITGAEFMCLGSSSFVGNPIPGGVWSSSNVGAVAVDVSGNVTATGVGTSTISYQLGSACYITRLLTVEPTLNALTGPSSVCESASITLANTFAGGIWSSSNTAVATVGTSGIVTGVLAGTTNITYETPLAHCFAMTTVTVDPVPAAITGDDNVCVGVSTLLSNATPAGTWSSSDGAIATVDASGNVTGITANTVLISYTVGSGCTTTLDFTVKPLANAGVITGSDAVCVNATTPLISSGDAGGTWSSANTDLATVGTAGDVSGVAVGTTTITYFAENECSIDTATFDITIKAAPDAGVLSAVSVGLCIDYTTTVSSTIAGGVWTSSDATLATINAAGVVTALSAGTVTISYSITNECGTDVATIDITVFSMAPHTVISIHPDTVLCANTMFQNFGAETSPLAGATYRWSAVNAEVYAQSSGNRQNALVNFTTPGIAVVRLTTQISNTGCFVVDSFTTLVNADSAFTAEVKYYAEELICTDNRADSYQWGYDDVNTLDSTLIFGAFQQSFYLPVPDFTNRRYWVISNHGGCYQKVYYNMPSSVVTASTNALEVNLFPNPAYKKLNMEVKGLTRNDEITVRLMDMFGREIESAVLVNGRGSVEVGRLASGMYSVIFLNNGVKVTARTFVKN